MVVARVGVGGVGGREGLVGVLVGRGGAEAWRGWPAAGVLLLLLVQLVLCVVVVLLLLLLRVRVRGQLGDQVVEGGGH
jgi:hypothetical protein